MNIVEHNKHIRDLHERSAFGGGTLDYSGANCLLVSEDESLKTDMPFLPDSLDTQIAILGKMSVGAVDPRQAFLSENFGESQVVVSMGDTASSLWTATLAIKASLLPRDYGVVMKRNVTMPDGVDIETKLKLVPDKNGRYSRQSVDIFVDALYLVSSAARARASRSHATILDKKTLFFDLTPRKLELLHLLADGFSTNEIANRLGISIRTVHNHLNAIYRKLDVQSQSDAVGYALSMGLVVR